MKVVSEQKLVDQILSGPLGFSKFKELSKKADIEQEIIDAENVTIFSPSNKDFDKLSVKFEDVELATLRRWMLKHFVKGFLFRKNMEFGPTPVSINPFGDMRKIIQSSQMSPFLLKASLSRGSMQSLKVLA